MSDEYEDNIVSTTYIKLNNNQKTTKKRKIVVLGAPGVGKSIINMR